VTTPSLDVAATTAASVAVLAIFVERALAIAFEHPLWMRFFDRVNGIKEIIALALSYAICKDVGFDAIALVTGDSSVHRAGLWITAATIAGGSKGSKRLFYELWGIKSRAAKNGGAR